VITYRESEAEAKKTVATVQAFGVKSMAIACNVREEASVQSAVAEAVDYLGGLDILVNNAGSFETVALEDITVEAWDAMFETNTRGPFLVARAALPHLRAGKGRIINLGSLGGLHPWTTHGHYCASKAALHMLSQTMAKAWAPEVAVNCVAPGMIVLGETSPFFEHFIQKTPMNRNGTGEDCAEAVLFFATATSFITGQLIAVDGGLGLSSRGEGSGGQ
jgi:NAD(P)-dependent dehydrogenase (short-subunit alcohol dehydrogenase family)